MIEFKEWTSTPDVANVVYLWTNNKTTLGVGRSHTASKQNRVNPSMTYTDISTVKDAGKTFISAYVSKLDNARLKLMWTEDLSNKTSINASELELSTKEQYTKDKFIVFNGQAFSKIDFMEEIFLPHCNSIFGIESDESMFATLAAGDGDLWSRFKRHPRGQQALQNIAKEMLWVDQ